MTTQLPGTARKIYRVVELTRLIRAILEETIGSVWVEGEVSGARAYPSGHVYFDLKDEHAVLKVVLFRAPAEYRALINDGARVRIYGEISVYEQRGQYQMIARRVEDAGEGDLMRRFEELKKKLEAEGLFDASRKRSLPLLPRTIGIVTSTSGAVIRDILNILNRRYPDRRILIAPTRVQGAGAASEIAAALDLLNEHGEADVIIVARGGGSMEDLWAFNEEVVARAVARSRIPVISAVGHETDFTICDFCADLRAPTPSAAAELVVRPKADFQQELRTRRRRLTHALQRQALLLRNRFLRASRSYVFREPANLLARHRERIARSRDRLGRLLEAAGISRRQRVDEMNMRSLRAVEVALQRLRRRHDRASEKLSALDPHAVLTRGYSITFGPDGKPLLDASTVAPGERIRSKLSHGEIWSNVSSIFSEQK
ncbi:MAG: exodeoxyribonuclease VII large subunit [Kiritimatiellae bacterium]|nr:exodeoxyribonuclease VII large subunit [Kiritimatiellia bacterium]MDW8458534.1 exodeoxyribonuclease VII large subunit [Verrucomicrobiota bacterium]